MSIAILIYAFILFFVLTPGVLVTLPRKGSKMMVALVHALIFAVVWTLTHKIVWRTSSNLFEGLDTIKKMNKNKVTKDDKKKDTKKEDTKEDKKKIKK